MLSKMQFLNLLKCLPFRGVVSQNSYTQLVENNLLYIRIFEQTIVIEKYDSFRGKPADIYRNNVCFSFVQN